MNIKDSVKILTEFKIYSQILYRSEVVKYISPLLSHSRLCSLPVDSSLLSVPFLFSLELRKLFSNAHCVRDYQTRLLDVVARIKVINSRLVRVFYSSALSTSWSTTYHVTYVQKLCGVGWRINPYIHPL